MRRKLFALAVVAGIAVFASWVPRAEAAGDCDAICGDTTPSNTPCNCGLGTDRPGRSSTCGLWQGTSLRGCFLL
jgi:hypothetical protein